MGKEQRHCTGVFLWYCQNMAFLYKLCREIYIQNTVTKINSEQQNNVGHSISLDESQTPTRQYKMQLQANTVSIVYSNTGTSKFTLEQRNV